MPSIDSLRAAAAEQATRLQSDFIGTEHLFLAWLAGARGPIADAVSAAGLTTESFEQVLAKGSKRGRGRRGGPAPGESGSLTSHAQRVLEMALERGRAAGRDEPGTDDLILAMVQEPRGAIARALTEFDIKPSRLKALASDRPTRGRAAARSAPASPAQEPASQSAAAEPQPSAARAQQRETRQPRGEQGRSRREQPAPQPSRTDPPQPVAAPPEIEPVRTRPRLDLERRPRLGWLSPLYLAIPVALGLHLAQAGAGWTCLAAALGAIPLAALLGSAVEQLVARLTPTAAAVVAAVLGNAAVVVFGVVALRHGMAGLATSLVAGSLLATALLVPGLGLLIGAARRGEPTTRARTGLLVPAAGLILLPTVVEHTVVGGALGRGLLLPPTFALLLAATLLLVLAATRHSSRPAFGGMQWADGPIPGSWSTGLSVALAVLALAGLAVMAELLMRHLVPSGATALISPVFLGLVGLPLLSSVPQLGTAITAAGRGQRDLAFQQVSASAVLLVLAAVPLLVGAAVLLGASGFDLVFGRFEALVLVGGVLASGAVIGERDPGGVEGGLLLVGYLLVATVAWFI